MPSIRDTPFADQPLKELRGDESVLEMVTPAKIFLAVLLREYLKIRAQNRNKTISTDPEEVILDIELTAKEKRDFFMLFLKLAQGKDLKFSELAPAILENPDYSINFALKAEWRCRLVEIMHAAADDENRTPTQGVYALMTFFDHIEKLVHDSSGCKLINP